MKREWTLAGGIVALVLAAVLVVALVPGVLSSPQEDVRRSFLDVRELNIGHGQPGGETVPLTVEARVAHDGGPAENVTVLFRAVSLESGLLEATREVEIGTVEGEREVPVTTNLTVERAGGYRIEAVVFEDGRRHSMGRKEVRGVESLRPAYADTSVEFHRFGDGGGADLPAVEYSIARADGNRTTLEVSTHLTNSGDAPSEDVRLLVKARQADSNILAAERSVEVGRIEPGRTATPGASLTVPAGYNYYLDAVLWKDGVIVGTARSAANLDPTETISVNETRRSIGLQVEDFQRGADGGDGGDGARRTPGPTPTEGAGPGFGPGLALVGLLATLLALARRRGDHSE